MKDGACLHGLPGIDAGMRFGDRNDRKLKLLDFDLRVVLGDLGIVGGAVALGIPDRIAQSDLRLVGEIGDLLGGSSRGGRGRPFHDDRERGRADTEFLAQLVALDRRRGIAGGRIDPRRLRVAGRRHDVGAVVLDREFLGACRHGDGNAVIDIGRDRDLDRLGLVVKGHLRGDGLAGSVRRAADLQRRDLVFEGRAVGIGRQAEVLQHEGLEFLVAARHRRLHGVDHRARGVEQGLDLAAHHVAGLIHAVLDSRLHQLHAGHAVDIAQDPGLEILRGILDGTDGQIPHDARIVLDHGAVFRRRRGADLGLHQHIVLGVIPALLGQIAGPLPLGAEIGDGVFARALGQAEFASGTAGEDGRLARVVDQSLHAVRSRHEARVDLVDLEVHDRDDAVGILTDVDLGDSRFVDRDVVRLERDRDLAVDGLDDPHLLVGARIGDLLKRLLDIVDVDAVQTVELGGIEIGLAHGVDLIRSHQIGDGAVGVRLIAIHDLPGLRAGRSIVAGPVIDREGGVSLSDRDFRIRAVEVRVLEHREQTALGVRDVVVVIADLGLPVVSEINGIQIGRDRLDGVVLDVVLRGELDLNVAVGRVDDVVGGRSLLIDIIGSLVGAHQRDIGLVLARSDAVDLDLLHTGAGHDAGLIVRIQAHLEDRTGENLVTLLVVQLPEVHVTVEILVADLDGEAVHVVDVDRVAIAARGKRGKHFLLSPVVVLHHHNGDELEVSRIGGGDGLFEIVILPHVEERVVCQARRVLEVDFAVGALLDGHGADLGAAGGSVIDVQRHGPVADISVGQLAVQRDLLGLQRGLLGVFRCDDHSTAVCAGEVGGHRGLTHRD